MDVAGVFTPGEHVLAAVSGGPDSVAMLLLLAQSRDAGAIRLTAAHYDHGIRAESASDHAFVDGLCARLGVPLIAERGDAPAYAQSHGVGLESAARALRYEFLFRAKEQSGATVIATAHHADDQAETVLMHMLRGAGLTGACGMQSRANGIARPLLRYTKRELLAFLDERGQDYCVDATNVLPDNPRNRLRLEAMPLLESIYPGSAKALCRFAHSAAIDDAWLDRHARDWAHAHLERFAFGYRMATDDAPEALMRRALAAILADADAVERVLDATRTARSRFSVPGYSVERTGGYVYLIRNGASPPQGEVALKDGARIEGLGVLHIAPCAPEPVYAGGKTQALSAKALEGAVVRTRRPGDRMRPLGAPGTRKLSDVMIDRGIDRPLRDWTPLVAKGANILWIIGEAIAQEARVDANTQAILLTWEDARDGGTEDAGRP